MTDEERRVHHQLWPQYNEEYKAELIRAGMGDLEAYAREMNRALVTVSTERIRALRNRLLAEIESQSTWVGRARNDVRREVIDELNAILGGEPAPDPAPDKELLSDVLTRMRNALREKP